MSSSPKLNNRSLVCWRIEINEASLEITPGHRRLNGRTTQTDSSNNFNQEFFSLKSTLSSRAVPNRKCEVGKLHLMEALRIKYVIKSSGSEWKVRRQQASLYGSNEDNYITLRNKKQVNDIKIMFMKNRICALRYKLLTAFKIKDDSSLSSCSSSEKEQLAVSESVFSASFLRSRWAFFMCLSSLAIGTW